MIVINSACRVHRLIHRLIRKGNRVSNRVSNKVAVKAFIRVLVARDLPESAKLVWLLLKLDQLDRGLTTKALLSPTRIQRQIGLSRPTIRKAIAHLRARALLTVNGRLPLPGDFPYDRHGSVASVIPRRLICNPEIPFRARVLHTLLLARQALLRTSDAPCSYATIAARTGFQPRTVRKAMLTLVDRGWLAIAQESQRAPIFLAFPDPETARTRADVMRAQQQLAKTNCFGETLFRLMADVLVPIETPKDDCYPEWLTNPRTGCLMQIDRFYEKEQVALEFNGPQHDGLTERFSTEEVQAQMERDRMKAQIIRRKNIPLITIRPEDLSFKRLRALLGAALPVRDVQANDPLVIFLENAGRRYRASMRKIQMRAQERGNTVQSA